jgi:nitronate monooxygenase
MQDQLPPSQARAHPVYVDTLIAAEAEDSIRRNLYHVGCRLCPSIHGVLRSAIEAAQALRDEKVGEIQMQGQLRQIARFQGVPPPIKQMNGHVEAMCCYAGQSVGDVRRAQSAAQIITELLTETAIVEAR